MDTSKDGKVICPRCSSDNTESRGKKNGKKQYRCKECEKAGRQKYFRDNPKPKLDETISETKDRREMTSLVPERITSLEQLISQCEIDTEVWEIERWMCNKWEAAREGVAVPLFQVKVWLKRKRKACPVGARFSAPTGHASRFQKYGYTRLLVCPLFSSILIFVCFLSDYEH